MSNEEFFKLADECINKAREIRDSKSSDYTNVEFPTSSLIVGLPGGFQSIFEKMVRLKVLMENGQYPSHESCIDLINHVSFLYAYLTAREWDVL